jgi:two-component system response regulator VicR
MPYVLIAEDDKNLANLWERAFRRAGFHVEVVYDGHSALERLQNGATLPDMLVTDQMMPGMQGSRLLEILYTELDPERRVASMMLTAHPESVPVHIAGLTDIILHKPVSYSDLVELAGRFVQVAS